MSKKINFKKLLALTDTESQILLKLIQEAFETNCALWSIVSLASKYADINQTDYDRVHNIRLLLVEFDKNSSLHRKPYKKVIKVSAVADKSEISSAVVI